MAENIPPSSNAAPTSATNTVAAADQPGRPYYESLRTTLRQTLDKKRKLDEQLAGLEDQIFKAEGAYLEETANSGNIVRGFDGWVKGVQVARGAVDDRRRGRFRDEDRVFSRSSVGWLRSQELGGGGAGGGGESNTPSHAATPTASFGPPALTTRGSEQQQLAAAANKALISKKRRPVDKDDDDEGKPKRSKITYARD